MPSEKSSSESVHSESNSHGSGSRGGEGSPGPILTQFPTAMDASPDRDHPAKSTPPNRTRSAKDDDGVTPGDDSRTASDAGTEPNPRPLKPDQEKEHAKFPVVTTPLSRCIECLPFLDTDAHLPRVDRLVPKFLAACRGVFPSAPPRISDEHQEQVLSMLLYIQQFDESDWSVGLAGMCVGMTRDLWSGNPTGNGLHDTLHECMTRQDTTDSRRHVAEQIALVRATSDACVKSVQAAKQAECAVSPTEAVRGDGAVSNGTGRRALEAEADRIADIAASAAIAKETRAKALMKRGKHRVDMIVMLPEVTGEKKTPEAFAAAMKQMSTNIDTCMLSYLPSNVRIPEAGIKYLKKWCANALSTVWTVVRENGGDCSVGGVEAELLLQAVRCQLPGGSDAGLSGFTTNGIRAFVQMKMTVADECVTEWSVCGTRLGYYDCANDMIVAYQRSISDSGTSVVSPRILLRMFTKPYSDEQPLKLTVWTGCFVGDDCVVPVPPKKNQRVVTIKDYAGDDHEERDAMKESALNATVERITDTKFIMRATASLRNAEDVLETSMDRVSRHERGDCDDGGSLRSEDDENDEPSHTKKTPSRKKGRKYATEFVDIQADVSRERSKKEQRHGHKKKKKSKRSKHADKKARRYSSEDEDSDDDSSEDGGGTHDRFIRADDDPIEMSDSSSGDELSDESDEESEDEFSDDRVERLSSSDDEEPSRPGGRTDKDRRHDDGRKSKAKKRSRDDRRDGGDRRDKHKREETRKPTALTVVHDEFRGDAL